MAVQASKDGPPAGGPDGPRRRHAAGADPAKRDQILAGARRAFMERGFDATSMSDVCRAAGVSKGTLYVYFAHKEELFAALIKRQRERLFAEIEPILTAGHPLPETLARFGRHLAAALCSDEVIRAQRTVIGIAKRMPEVGARFHEAGARRTQGSLRRYLEAEAEAGRLTLPDPGLAAIQFIELATAGLWRPRLFGASPQPPTKEAVGACVDAAVAMFLAHHGRERP